MSLLRGLVACIDVVGLAVNRRMEERASTNALEVSTGIEAPASKVLLTTAFTTAELDTKIWSSVGDASGDDA